jgi:hypothetical protein
MSYSPMQDACPHSIPISDISTGNNSYRWTIGMTPAHQPISQNLKPICILYIIWGHMKFSDDTNSLILNLALHLVNPVVARLVFFFLSVFINVKTRKICYEDFTKLCSFTTSTPFYKVTTKCELPWGPMTSHYWCVNARTHSTSDIGPIDRIKAIEITKSYYSSITQEDACQYLVSFNFLAPSVGF